MSGKEAVEEEYSVEKVLDRRVRNGKVRINAFIFFLWLSFFYCVHFLPSVAYFGVVFLSVCKC